MGPGASCRVERRESAVSRFQTPTAPWVVDRTAARIEAHLERLADGHDPFGHLFAIERLARAARADWCETERRSAPGRGQR